MKLQREGVIVIKRCDKGAGIIILYFDEYMRACHVHLSSKLNMQDGSTQDYYTKVDKTVLNKYEVKLKHILEEGLDHKIITKSEYDAMDPGGKTAAKFYCTFKVHKTHEPMRAPPEQPIVSACGSMMENASQFVEHHMKAHGKQHASTPQTS